VTAHQVFPVASGDALFQSDDPLAPVHVRLVLPHRLDPLTEDMVVAHGRPVIDWPPQVDVETPEVLDLERGRGRWGSAVFGAVVNAVYGVVARWGPRETRMAGIAYRLCGAEHGGILLVALVRRLLEESEGPRELKRVRFYDRGHRLELTTLRCLFVSALAKGKCGVG
jgi:hypothetical protein